VTVRSAPWASPIALDRLAAVEAALPLDAAAALAAAATAAEAHVRRIDSDALLLYAGGNVPTGRADALHHALLSNQPSMGYPGGKYQAGLEELDVIEVTVTRLIADVMGARFAEVRPTSATLANLAVYTAVCQPGETIAVLPGWAGGHVSHHAVGAPGVRGLNVAELPYDVGALDVDLEALPAFLERETPRLVVVGASLMLRPHRLREIADIVGDTPLLYDASHVSGLIAEGRFQAPLTDGADLVTFSTYKSFGGPAGGAIVSNDAALMERVTTAVYPGLLANYDIARLLPLGVAAVEHLEWAGTYADACIGTAQRLAVALIDEGCVVIGGGTASHHVAVDARPHGGGTAAALRLAEANILLSEIGCPTAEHDPAGAIRIGTQTVVRQGVEDMATVARLIADGLFERRELAAIRADVRRLRREEAG
jgi:glycine hydroxymethyltransferase